MGIIGCDLGNAFAYASILNNVNSNPIPLLVSEYKLDEGMPADAFFVPPDGKEIVVYQGKTTAAQMAIKQRAPGALVRAVKTRLKEKSIKLAKIKEPVEIMGAYAAIARDLLVLANEELSNKGMEPSSEIVFTFPAGLADDPKLLDEMQKSIESQKVNGENIVVKGRLPEPAAVAIDYLHYMQHLAPESVRITREDYTVLVYDLGHGTFDCAVVTARSVGEPYKLHFKESLPDVGGQDFDRILYDEICSQLKSRYHYTPSNENMREQILREAVRVKYELSSMNESVVSIPVDGEYCDVEITRQRFEELSLNLLLRTLDLVQELLDCAEEENISIDGIVLSGGSSRMPMVERSLKELSNGSCSVTLYRPSEAVSYGAARYAHGISNEAGCPSNTVLEQAADCCYGWWVRPWDKPNGEVTFLIPSGEKLPAQSEPFTFHANSGTVDVKLYRSRQKNQKLPPAMQVEDCESLIWIPFNTIPDTDYELTLTVEENYTIKATLRGKEGAFQKSTADSVEELTGSGRKI